jgi:hypothetical protein
LVSNGLETIEAGAHDIHAPVGDQTRQVLPHALAHDARLAVVHAETLFAQNGGDVRSKPLHASLECFAAGKRQIVSRPLLTKCARLGPESQNRDAHPYFRAHLEGRVGFVESINPGRGRRLRAILEQIRWQ